MRLTISHETGYNYDMAPSAVVELLRLTPPSTANQTVRSWRIDVTGDAVLRRAEDAFGNIVHTFSVSDPGVDLRITASGTVDTEPTSGEVSGAPERQPVGVFLRQTALTEAGTQVRDLAAAASARSGGSQLDRAHAMNVMVHESMRYETGRTTVATTADAALEAGRGVCQDLTHVLIAAARADGLPARYVSGYQFVEGRERAHHESHAWAEIHIDDLGWISFDPTMGACATDAYVRLAVGLDTMSASPLRGAVYGGTGEVLNVAVTIDRDGGRQGQTRTTGSQSQTMDGQSRTSGGQSQASDGQSQTPGGQSQTPGGQSQTPGGQSQTPGSMSQTPGGQSQTPGGQSQTMGSMSQTLDGRSPTPGGPSRSR